MKILILSRKGSLYSTRRLREACKVLGVACQVADPLACTVVIDGPVPRVYGNSKELRSIDAVVPRIGAYGARHGIAVVHAFDDQGVPTLNHHEAIERVKDKLGCLQRLAKAGLPVPTTVLTRSPKAINRALEAVGGVPVILKFLRGTQGTGVMSSESVASARSMLDAIWSLGEDVLLQRFVSESRGRDLRVLVVGGEVVAAMRRHACEGEFRSNIHRGGVGEAIVLPRPLERLALQAARITGMEVAGIDILESAAGPLLLEVNSSPGFQGLEEATGIDIALRIMERALKLAGERRKLCATGPSR